MTIRNVYAHILTELNKVQAPSLLLDDFVYLFNKGVQEYENERYNLFETKQQLTDDLRVLTKSAELSVSALTKNVFDVSYLCNLPSDYVHILNCVCKFKDGSPHCDADSEVLQGANKLTTNLRSHIINNYYLKPSVRNPYYYIINADEPNADSTGAVSDESKGNIRYGNNVLPVMQILCGNSTRYTLESIFIDYLRAPKHYTLTLDELDEIEDTTQVIEFPDYVIYEIINRIVKLIMENGLNPRVQTHPAVNASIA